MIKSDTLKQNWQIFKLKEKKSDNIKKKKKPGPILWLLIYVDN